MFLKQKRDGTIKGHTVAGVKKQRHCISKEDTSSSIVAMILNWIIDAEEGRDDAMVDIPNALIQNMIEDEKDMIMIWLQGTLLEMLLDIAHTIYQAFVSIDR
jgi:hypothetical protein